MATTSNHHNDEVFKEKKKLKRPIRFGVTLNEEQKIAKAYMLENPITAIRGKAGSGKTLLPRKQMNYFTYKEFDSPGMPGS